MEHFAPALAPYLDAALQSRFRKQLLDGRRCKRPMTYGAWMSMVRQFTRLPGASTSLPAYWQSKAISTDWQCAMRVLHGKEKFDSSRAARRKKMQAAAGVRRHKKKSVKLEGRWYNKEWRQQEIKYIRKKARSNMLKRPAKCAPSNMESNMESLADWLQTRDYPSRGGKTKKERKLAEFVHVQKQAYLGNRQPYLTIHAIRKFEELPGWTFPLPSFGEMLGKLEGPSLARPAPSHDSAVPDAPKEPERNMHVHRQQQHEGWIAIGYAYGHWKQALRRRSGIDAKDATPQQIAAFKRKVQFLSTNAEREGEAKRETKLNIVHEHFGGDWTDDLGPNGCTDFFSLL
jgi:hypothetical protein